MAHAVRDLGIEICPLAMLAFYAQSYAEHPRAEVYTAEWIDLMPKLGVTVGFHRYLTHRSFETSRTMRALLAILGSAAIEGPVIEWVANHRKHHAFSDEEGDPHSPHVGFGGGAMGAVPLRASTAELRWNS